MLHQNCMLLRTPEFRYLRGDPLLQCYILPPSGNRNHLTLNHSPTTNTLLCLIQCTKKFGNPIHLTKETIGKYHFLKNAWKIQFTIIALNTFGTCYFKWCQREKEETLQFATAKCRPPRNYAKHWRHKRGQCTAPWQPYLKLILKKKFPKHETYPVNKLYGR